jgi:hypothetical protein
MIPTAVSSADKQSDPIAALEHQIDAINVRIRHEDGLFNTGTQLFINASGILVAAFGWAKDDSPVRIGIACLGFVIAVLWSACVVPTEAFVDDLHTKRRELRKMLPSGYFDPDAVMDGVRPLHPKRGPTKLLAWPLPWIFIIGWIVAGGWIAYLWTRR